MNSANGNTWRTNIGTTNIGAFWGAGRTGGYTDYNVGLTEYYTSVFTFGGGDSSVIFQLTNDPNSSSTENMFVIRMSQASGAFSMFHVLTKENLGSFCCSNTSIDASIFN